MASTGTGVVKFFAIYGVEKCDETKTINTRFQCITGMKEYEDKSLEELRYEDYVENRKKAHQISGGVFGLNSGTKWKPFEPTDNHFRNINLFGSTENKTPFSNTTQFSSKSSSSFGITQPFGTTHSKPFFGNASPSTSTLTKPDFGITQPFGTTHSKPFFGNASPSTSTLTKPDFRNSNTFSSTGNNTFVWSPSIFASTENKPHFVDTVVFGSTGNKPPSGHSSVFSLAENKPPSGHSSVFSLAENKPFFENINLAGSTGNKPHFKNSSTFGSPDNEPVVGKTSALTGPCITQNNHFTLGATCAFTFTSSSTKSNGLSVPSSSTTKTNPNISRITETQKCRLGTREILKSKRRSEANSVPVSSPTAKTLPENEAAVVGCSEKFRFHLSNIKISGPQEENSEEAVKKIMSGIQELIECPICFGKLDSSLKQCENGHGICGLCVVNMEKCPTCQHNFIPYKPILLWKILNRLPKQCSFADSGCDKFLNEKEEHETFCRFRPISCKFNFCDWKGTVEGVLDHVRNCKRRTENSLCEVYFPNVNIKQIYSFNKSEDACFYTAVIFDNQLFWKYFHRDGSSKMITLKFYHISLSKPMQKYYLVVSFNKGEIEFKTCVGASYETVDDSEDKKENEISFFLPDQDLERFYNLEVKGYVCCQKIVVENI